MGFNLKSFLRRMSPDVLRRYLSARKISLSNQIDWHDSARTQVDAMVGAINALSERERDAIIIDFENAEQLCDQVGQIALHSVAARDASVLSLLQAANTDVAKSIELLLANDTLFERALAAAYADRLLRGRSWGAYNIEASATVSLSIPNLPAFEAEAAVALARPDGSIGKLKIDRFERVAVRDHEAAPAVSVHYAIYSEGLPVSDVEFLGADLKRETRRPVHEGAILYDADGRTLDVVAGGGKAVRDRIAASFARNMLGVQGKIHPVTVRRFALDRLRRPMEFVSDSADGIKSVKVTMLRLAHTGSRYNRVTLEADPADHTNICTRSALWFGENPLRSPEWSVTHATLLIVFHPEPGGTREKAASIQLRAPNGSNLRDQTWHHQLISHRYLAEWGLIAVPGR